ncbi:hypothetical protein DL766_008270 [Monosporascus sp. MC13-8B]|uniref:Uncharacterized protein n=1 Tax=Monosporascus cannonballus TaxID=155416 RepID=A0ABY0H892_9PEZI|nr:hypothetical protein DL762_005785 [Monosporascus cannonballus]RYO85331.1 hypothetical protein DL763_007146 [Monosporascus cannonballus]RYP20134.1 hypothetical protein DL766_008270 [Monosporascus sp. MC13-8B]
MSSPSTPTPTQGAQQRGGCVPEPPGNEELAPWVEAAAPAPAEFQWKVAAPGGIRSREERRDAREAKEHGQEGSPGPRSYRQAPPLAMSTQIVMVTNDRI